MASLASIVNTQEDRIKGIRTPVTRNVSTSFNASYRSIEVKSNKSPYVQITTKFRSRNKGIFGIIKRDIIPLVLGAVSIMAVSALSFSSFEGVLFIMSGLASGVVAVTVDTCHPSAL